MAVMRNPRSHFKPLAIGAPDPVFEIPVTPMRMIHFFDPSNEKLVARLGSMAASADIVLGNLEDAIPADRKEAARAGLVRAARETDLGGTPLWTRVNDVVPLPTSWAPGTSRAASPSVVIVALPGPASLRAASAACAWRASENGNRAPAISW